MVVKKDHFLKTNEFTKFYVSNFSVKIFTLKWPSSVHRYTPCTKKVCNASQQGRYLLLTGENDSKCTISVAGRTLTGEVWMCTVFLCYLVLINTHVYF